MNKEAKTILMGVVIAGGMLAFSARPPVLMAVEAPSRQATEATADQIRDKIGEALKHAKEAEDSGRQGKTDALVKHAEKALNKAKDAQKAGHNERLNEGVYAPGRGY